MIKVYSQQNDRTSSDEFLRKCLAKFLDISPEGLKLDRHSSGQPFLVGHKISFSLSHSENFWLCACSDNFDVGVDVQAHRPFNSRLFERCCTPQELSRLPSRDASVFYDIWTIKEAALKCLGTGLAYPMNKLEIDSQLKTVQVLENRPHIRMIFEGQTQELVYESLSVFAGSTSHVVWSRQKDEPRVELLRIN